ncbi:oxidoreductase short chain dehydrogenase/reductase [Venturia nashicola]|nr:oxidoreductase short chain dehydrogenase/reductase [Venturia nashicola]
MPPGAEKAPALASREELTKRTIPHMLLSNGSSTSSTAPPTTSAKSAEARFSVKGTAIVTGGTGTLGLAAATALLQHGLQGLMLFDVNIDPARKKLNNLRAEFPDAKIEALSVDVTDEIAVQQAVEETAQLLGSVDILLCYAGVVGCVNALDMPASQWRKILEINTTGSFICAQAAARQMVKQGSGGSIIFTASISAHRVNYPQPQAAYNVSKAALLSLKSCLAAEWARYGIRTNTISPGYMDTILNEGDGLAETRKVWSDRNPMGRMGVPSELTGAVVLLASSAGTYINGADIVVDGGAIVF